MTDENAFLDAIASEPKGSPRRLIYADWLEEKGDSRAELIRLEEEMRTLAVYSDRYWELKPRRNELRQEADSNWLEVMRYGTDYEPVFAHGWPDGWKERWRIVRRWVEIWRDDELPDVGGHRDEVSEIEQRLGLILPPSICEWVAFARDLEESEHCKTLIPDRVELQLLSEHSSLSLHREVENLDMHWAVNLDLLDLPDPPVDNYIADYHYEPLSFDPVPGNPLADSTSWYALDRVTSFGGFSRYQAELGQEFPTKEYSGLLDSLEPAFSHRCKVEEAIFFERNDLVVQVGKRPIFLDVFGIDIYAPKTRKLSYNDLPKAIKRYFPEGL